ncbi:MAG: hypothetical protein KBD31_03010 [Proteobacteria bacterium]|nr:hypothetical protein [Pseudomonadota bacterium]
MFLKVVILILSVNAYVLASVDEQVSVREVLQKQDAIDRLKKVRLKEGYRKDRVNKIQNFQPLSFSEKIERMIQDDKVPFTEIVKKLIESQEIPLPYRDIDDVVIEDLTSNTVGRARLKIIKIGLRVDATDNIKWFYIFKETGDSAELKGVNAAYQMFDRGILKKGPYTLKMAWHEKLWKFPTDKDAYHNTPYPRYFELLHAAKGVSMESLVDNFFARKTFLHSGDDPIFDRNEWRFINDDDYDYETIMDEYKRLRKKSRNGTSEDQKELNTFLVRYGISSVIDQKTIHKGDILPFNKDGTIFIGNVEELVEAYRAFGTMMGTYVKPYQKGQEVIDAEGKIFKMPELDPHGNNIFYDAMSQTITWIDLQKTGEFYTDKRMNTYSILSYSFLNIDSSFFYEQYNSLAFLRGVEFCFPNYKEDPVLMKKLIQERNRLYLSLKRVIEAFYDGFISNWEDPEDQAKLKDYFKGRNKFAYHTADEVFTDPHNPFTFK